MPPEALLFDLDGTLLDSERLWYVAQQRTMEYFGKTWTDSDQANSIGGPLERVVQHITSRTGGEHGHVARILVAQIEHLMATRQAHWMPGARELMVNARAQGIPVAVVSNSWRVLLDLALRHVDVPTDATISSTEVVRPKPDPEPYLTACRALGASPTNTVVVEDSPTGVTAGLAAGCRVIAVGPAVAHLNDPQVRVVPTLAGLDPMDL